MNVMSILMSASNQAAHKSRLGKKLLIVLVSILLYNCSRDRPDNTIDYLGQDKPGLNAELFSPGLISTDSLEHSAPAFSPDGSVVLWTVLDRAYRASMMEMTFENGRWSKPHRPTFADSTADDYYPSFSGDGKKLFFSSRRKVPEGYPENRGIRIWEVDRLDDGWSDPVPFDTVVSNGEDYAHSITRNGTLYFSASHGGPLNWNLMRAEKQAGRYSKPVMLPYNINSVGYEDGPYVAPDESFIIFESQRPEGIGGSVDLYVSFRKESGWWTIPVNMGQKVNSTGAERFARLSPDGKYLFFGSTRNASETKRGFDIFWVDAAVIDELRKEATAQNQIDMPLGEEIVESLLNNETDSASSQLKKWLSLHPSSLDATVVYSSLLRKQKNYSGGEVLLGNVQPSWNDNTSVVMEKALMKFGMNKDDDARKLLAPLLAEGDQQRERYIYLSRALLDMERFETSDDYFEKAMVIHASPFPYFNRGCAYAKIGQKDKAFVALNKAVELGINVRNEYENNIDLLNLKDDPRWKSLMAKMGG